MFCLNKNKQISGKTQKGALSVLNLFALWKY